jgi:hypothetical protein
MRNVRAVLVEVVLVVLFTGLYLAVAYVASEDLSRSSARNGEWRGF